MYLSLKEIITRNQKLKMIILIIATKLKSEKKRYLFTFKINFVF